MKLLTFFSVLVLAVLAMCKQQQLASLTELQSAKDSTLRQLHTVMSTDITQLRVVPTKDRKLQAVAGWAYAGLYYQECDDEDDAFFSIGFATEVCLSSAPTADKPPRSFIYSCSDESWTEAIYNNYNCDPAGYLNSTVFNVTTGECGAYPPVPTDDDSLSAYVARYYCTEGPTLNLDVDYVLNQYYDTDNCTEMGYFDGNRNGGCFPFFFNDLAYSYITKYPTETYYGGDNCKGTVVDEVEMDPLVPTCSAPPTDDDGDDDDINDINWSGYTSSVTCTLPTTTTCGDGGDDDDDSLSDGAIAGAVVGSIAGAGLIGAGAYFMVSTGSAGGAMASQGAGAAAASPV